MRYRVFSAIELSAGLRQHLAGVQDRFSAAVPGDSVRWADPDGIHLTLKFYGDVDTQRLPDIQAGLARAAAGAGPVRLAVEGLGVFPNPQRPQVIWAGVAGDLDGLQGLQAAVEREAKALGFKPEERDYAPHLTLGRVNARLKPSDHRALIDYLAQARLDPVGEMQARELQLVRSQLRAGGSLYTPLFTAPLGQPAPDTGLIEHAEETTPGND